ncbi:MAG TPA: acyltransferase [Chloroflexota bacterium]|nr:acyltransferase [Chloroflexota bacterium]
MAVTAEIPVEKSQTEAAPRPRASRLARLGIPATAGNRLPGVDGLRAVAALWVVLFHMDAFSHARFHLLPLQMLLRTGSTGVSLFLVLSGFCLYIPFAGGRTDRFRTRDFLLRRCRRLMPAYYVSLAIFLVLNIGLFAWLGFPGFSGPNLLLQALAHATLTHTLFTNTFYAVNGAYWSLGLEWQLYLSMPFIIWGIRRFGLTRTVATVVCCNILYGLVLGLLIRHNVIAGGGPLANVVLPNELFGRWAEFAFGVAAAELYVTGRLNDLGRRLKWVIPCLIPAFVAVSVWSGLHGLVIGAGRHIMYGLVFFCLLSLVLASNNIVSRLAGWTPLVVLGTMSYSLYLVHQPIVQGLAYVGHTYFHLGDQADFIAVFACLPFILMCAWVLFYTVERHTLTSKKAKRVEATAERAAPLETAVPQPGTATS